MAFQNWNRLMALLGSSEVILCKCIISEKDIGVPKMQSILLCLFSTIAIVISAFIYCAYSLLPSLQSFLYQLLRQRQMLHFLALRYPFLYFSLLLLRAITLDKAIQKRIHGQCTKQRMMKSWRKFNLMESNRVNTIFLSQFRKTGQLASTKNDYAFGCTNKILADRKFIRFLPFPCRENITIT